MGYSDYLIVKEIIEDLSENIIEKVSSEVKGRGCTVKHPFLDNNSPLVKKKQNIFARFKATTVNVKSDSQAVRACSFDFPY
jgi:hypothetical protein